MKASTVLFLLFSLVIAPALAQEGEKELTQVEKEAELLDFNSIRDVLKKDNLETNAEKAEKKVEKVKKKRKKKIVKKYDFPEEGDFWKIMSEYWLVKNATVLKWNFQRPDYGIGEAFRVLLEKLGHYEIKFNILYLNTPNIFHMALPYPDDEYLFLLSVPFIRTLDLSKLEISVLLYEDFLRAKSSLFTKKVQTKELQKNYDSNFYKKDLDKKIFEKLLRRYDKVVFERGFDFKEQFAITKQMDAHLKSEPKLWNVYYGLLKKIDSLIKDNLLYSHYPKIFPSPELQRGWLSPDSKNKL